MPPRAFLIAILALAAWGDSIVIAKKYTVLSENKNFRVELTRGENPVFSARGAMGLYFPKATFTLPNVPRWALVSNDGNRLVTFEESTDSAVAIYRTNGTLIHRLSLGQLLTANDIDTFSDRWWGGAHYLNDRGELVLQIASNGKSALELDATFHELRIDLASGEPLEPKRDLFDAAYRKNSIRYISPGILRPNPIVYPRHAKLARLQATVIADVQLNAQGVIDNVEIRQCHPLFVEATHAALLNARIENAGSAQVAVSIIFELRP